MPWPAASMSPEDFTALALTAKLAALSTVLLLILGTPVADRKSVV